MEMIDSNQDSHSQFLEQKKQTRQNDVIRGFGVLLTSGKGLKESLRELSEGLIKVLEYFYVKIEVDLGSNERLLIENTCDPELKKQLNSAVQKVEAEAIQSSLFKMLPITSKIEVKHELFRVKRSYDSFAVSKPIVHSGQVLGCITGVKAKIGNLNPKVEQSLLTMISTLIAQAAVIEKNKINPTPIGLRLAKQKGFTTQHVVGNSKQLQSIFEMIRQVSASSAVVSLHGEAGIGKSVFAKCIHANSERSDASFVKFNACVLDQNSIEKALFGFESEVSSKNVIGAVEKAEGGTLYIDAIDTLSQSLQYKLLRLLSEGVYQRIGSDEIIEANIRLLVSTSKSLDEVEKSDFIAELFYKISSFPIVIPPLKERKSDIIPLADYFVEKFSKKHRKNIDRISTPAIDMLSSYHWPGNVRELEGCIERAVLLTNESVLRGHHLPPSLQKVNIEHDKGINLKQRLESVEKELILDALKSSRGNMAKAARSLGLTERVMGLRVNSHDINVKKFKCQNT